MVIRSIFRLIVFIFSVSSLYSQETKTPDIVKELYAELHSGKYEEGFHTANLFRRRISGKLLWGSCLFAEYARMCMEESLPIGDDELKQFIEMYKVAYLNAPSKYIRQLDVLANFFFNNQFYDNSVIVFDAILNDRHILSPEEQVKYLCGRGWAYNYSREPYKAYQSFNESAVSSEEHFGIVSEQYAKSLNGMAYECKYLHKDGLSHYHKLTSIYKQLYGENSKVLAINYDNIGGQYTKNYNQQDSALVYIQKAYSILKSIDDHSEDMMKCLSNMGVCYSKLKKYSKALECYMSALEYGGASTLMYNIAYDYKEQGLVDKAFEYIEKMDSVWKNEIRADFTARCYAAKNDIDNFVHYYDNYLNYRMKIWQNNFVEMVSSERESFLFKGYDCAFDSLFVIAHQTKNSDAIRICYEYLLKTKSLSFSFDKHIGEYILSTNNSELIAEYAETTRLNNLAKFDKNLSLQAQKAEEHLLHRLSQLTDYTELLDINITDISNVLNEDEIAIEFYNADEHDNKNLYAVLLTKNNEVSIINFGPAETIDETKIWRTLYGNVSSYRNIYFAGDGIVNRLPIESAIVDGEDISSKHNIFRLSSTRQLTLNHSYNEDICRYVL